MHNRISYPEQSIVVTTNYTQTETWVQLSVPATEGDQWEVRAANGNLIDSGSLASGCVEFSLNTLSYLSGIYTVTVFDEKNKISTELNIVK